MILGLFSHATAAPVSGCAQTWTAEGVGDVIASADGNWRRADKAGMIAARDLLLVRLGCVTEPLSPTLIADIHRVMAGAAQVEGEPQHIAPALAGLLAAHPGYQMPPEMYPDGSPMREGLSFAGLLLREPGARALAQLPSGWLEVDGAASSTVPAARAAVVQQIDGDGAVVESRYVWPEDDLGRWAALPQVARERRGPNPPLLVGTLVSAAATGVMWGVAYKTRQDFLDLEHPYTGAEMDAAVATSHGLTVAYAVTGAATLGMGVGLFATW